MAGEWIKVEIGLPEKPEVMRLARILGKNKPEIVGILVKFWAWIDKNTVDGVVDGLEASDVDDVVSVDGFGHAMRDVNWLLEDKEGRRIIVPKFDRHNGESAKKRALKNERQARWRANSASTGVDDEPSTPASTREEKRRSTSMGADRTPNPRKKPARACPETFEVNDTMAQWAVSQGLPGDRVIPETEKFLDHWRATGKLRNDWDATWRNWIRKAVEFGQR